jgi:hypothetical protein
LPTADSNGVLGNHRLSTSIVFAAIVCITGVFLFARPSYNPARGQEIRGDKFKAPEQGWRWADGTPGFRFGQDEEHWNFSRLGPRELASARAAAARFGVDPASVRPLHAMRLGAGDLSVIVAGSGASGRTCLGFIVPRAPVSFRCPTWHVGFVVVAARPEFGTRSGRGFPFFVMGVARAEVTRVVVTTPSVSETVHRDGSSTFAPFTRQVLYSRGDGWWGTFSLTQTNLYRKAVPTRPWRFRVDFFGADGLLASQSLALPRAGDRVVAVSRS